MLALPMNGGELVFDATRFAGGHVYQLQVRGAGAKVASGFVYLYPQVAAPKGGSKRPAPQHLKFDEDAASSGGGDAIQIISKRGL